MPAAGREGDNVNLNQARSPFLQRFVHLSTAYLFDKSSVTPRTNVGKFVETQLYLSKI
jgi:hypothetical protein